MPPKPWFPRQINLLKLQRRQLRLQALEDDRKAARHYPAEMEPESDFDDDVRVPRALEASRRTRT